MIYRNLCGEKISQLGFGCMRLPFLHKDPNQIDKETASLMLKEAINKGVNYLDTAWPYHGGMSELVVGEFLKENHLRKDVFLATKLPVWLCKEPNDFHKYLDKQLEKLQTDTIDFYLLHALDTHRWDVLKKQPVEKFIQEAKASGKVKYLGFSFHGSLSTFKEICDSDLFDFCQIQLNYMDIHYQAGLEGLRYAKAKGIPVIIMEPLKGGKLAFELKGHIKEIWDRHKVGISPAELALKYLYDLTELNLVLSGMSTLEQVNKNIEIASNCTIGDLTDGEKLLIEDIRNYLKEKTKINCTSCNYCSECPQEIPIDEIFDFFNTAYIYDSWDDSKIRYSRMDENKRASNCIECGQCEDHCPQNISIIEALKESHAALAGK